jgi:hypothetical protein
MTGSNEVTLKDGSTMIVDAKSVGHLTPGMGEPMAGNCGKCFVIKANDPNCQKKDASILVMGIDVSGVGDGFWSPEVSQNAQSLCHNPNDTDYHWKFKWQEIKPGSHPGCQNE